MTRVGHKHTLVIISFWLRKASYVVFCVFFAAHLIMEFVLEPAYYKKKEDRRKYYLKNKDKFACDLCDIRKESFSHLERHRKTHSDSNKGTNIDGMLFPCHLCEYEGKDKAYLRQHVKRKHENHEFICGQVSYTKENHTQNPYCCEYCGHKTTR